MKLNNDNFISCLKKSKLDDLKKDKNKLDKFLIKTDGREDTIGHRILFKEKDKTVVENYIALLAGLPKAIVQKLLLHKPKDNWTIGHLIARYHPPEAVQSFLSFIKEQAPEVLAKVLTDKENNDDWTVGHFIARFHPPEAVQSFLSFIKEQAPEVLAKVLTDKTNSGWTVVHFIKTMDSKGDKGIKGAMFYNILTHQEALPESVLESIKNYKEKVLTHIECLLDDTDDTKERVRILKNATNRNSNLGRFFRIQREFFKVREHKGTLGKLNRILAKAKQELKEQKHFNQKALLDELENFKQENQRLKQENAQLQQGMQGWNNQLSPSGMETKKPHLYPDIITGQRQDYVDSHHSVELQPYYSYSNSSQEELSDSLGQPPSYQKYLSKTKMIISDSLIDVGDEVQNQNVSNPSAPPVYGLGQRHTLFYNGYGPELNTLDSMPSTKDLDTLPNNNENPIKLAPVYQ